MNTLVLAGIGGLIGYGLYETFLAAGIGALIGVSCGFVLSILLLAWAASK